MIKRKKDVIDEVARKSRLTIKDTTEFVDALLEVISENLEEGNEVLFSGFGKFEVRDRAGRAGTNPITQEPIMIPPTKIPYFDAGKNLRERVRGE